MSNREVIKRVPFQPLFNVVVEKNDKNYGPREIIQIEQPDFVSIMVKIRHKDKFIMVRQNRWGIDADILEPVCGLVDDGELPIKAAAREASEELGLFVSTSDLTFITAKKVNPAQGGSSMYAYAMSIEEDDVDLTSMKKNQHLDKDEHVSIEFIENISSALSMQNQILSLYNNIIIDGVRIAPEIIISTY